MTSLVIAARPPAPRVLVPEVLGPETDERSIVFISGRFRGEDATLGYGAPPGPRLGLLVDCYG